MSAGKQLQEACLCRKLLSVQPMLYGSMLDVTKLYGYIMLHST